MNPISCACSITLFVLFGILPLLLNGQVPAKHSPDTPGFSTVVVKDGNRYTGSIIDTINEKLIFHDNQLGQIQLDLKGIKKVEPEEPDAIYQISIRNNNEFVGTIVDRGENFIQIETSDFGILTFQIDHIVTIQKLQQKSVQKGQYWFPNPNYTRYLFAPSAIPLKKSEGYYQNAYVIANSANYGITNNLSLGGGVLLPFAAYATPKISAKVYEGFYIGAGVLVGLLPEQSLAGIGYGLLTFGNPENNLTFGAGYGFIDDETTDKPIFTINGMARISEKIALVSENWIINMDVLEDDSDNPEKKYRGYISYGVRFMWDRFTIDAAFINGPEIYDTFFIGVPYIDFIMRF